MPDTKAKVENIIASTHFKDRFDMEKAAEVLDVKYSPDFPGLIWEDKEEGVAVIVFDNGKMILTGARTLSDVGSHFRDIAQKLKHADLISHLTLQAKVKNIMASYDLRKEVNLDLSLRNLKSGRTRYVPDDFPGIIYNVTDPNITVLIFKSGKLALTGARKMSDIDDAVEIVKRELGQGGEQ